MSKGEKSGRMPVASGDQLVRFLRRKFGYEKVRQKGSHAIVQAILPSGRSTISVPLKKTLAKGTLGDIMAYVATRHGVNKEDLLRDLGS